MSSQRSEQNRIAAHEHKRCTIPNKDTACSIGPLHLAFLTFSTSSFTRCVQMVVLQEPFLIVAYARCRGSEDFVKLLRGTVLMVVKNFQGLHNRPYSAWTALNAG